MQIHSGNSVLLQIARHVMLQSCNSFTIQHAPYTEYMPEIK
jgi:hypothetical protein